MQTSAEQPGSPGLAWLKEFGSTVVDLLFPPRCAACHHLGDWFCAHCQDKVETIQPPVCSRCGLPLGEPVPPDWAPLQPSAQICARCRATPPKLDRLLACAFHSDPLRQAIHDFKYQDVRCLAATLGKLMAEGWSVLAPESCKIDAIVPVPLHAARLRQRGYNQAALLARELGARLHQPVVETVLIRTRATAPQVGLSVQERQANVRDAFRCTDATFSGRKLLLIDDVCTSGSTLEASGAALRKGGASSVVAFALARAR